VISLAQRSKEDKSIPGTDIDFIPQSRFDSSITIKLGSA
jgi:hypothetical protein